MEALITSCWNVGNYLVWKIEWKAPVLLWWYFFPFYCYLFEGCTDKKEKKNFPHIYKEIQMRSGTKSYMRKDFLIYD
jgi:hypothetical protein